MKRSSLAAMLAVVCQTAFAFADAPRYVGKPDCQVLDMQGETDRVEVRWDGACKDGFADGEGKLEFVRDQKTLLRYTGEVRRGAPDGAGYLARHTGTIMEGTFKDGKLDGKGVATNWYARHEGEFRGGLADGYGKATFTLGGSYEGQWKGGRFHGKGTAVYSSGRVFTGEFVEGVPAGEPKPVLSDRTYRLTSDKAPAGHTLRIPRVVVEKRSSPFKPYDKMTPEQQETVRSMYPLLDKNDEPPYHEDGGVEIYRYFVDEIQKFGTQGDLTIVLDIDSTGKVTGATVSQAPDRHIARVAMSVLMQEKFKPAKCAGKPCAMKYPFKFRFIGD